MGCILVARHGASEWNLSETGERVRGWDPVRLSSVGRWEAFDLANRIARKYRIGTVYTSDLPRAQETAEAIADRVKASISPSIDLRTWNLGYLTGCVVANVLADLQFYDANQDECPKDGESKKHFIERYERDLWELMSDTRKSKYDSVLVTHSRNCVATPNLVAGRPQAPYRAIPTGALMELRPDGKRWKIILFRKALRAIVDGEVELSEGRW